MISTLDAFIESYAIRIIESINVIIPMRLSTFICHYLLTLLN